jgi:UDP-N-acetylglucosamine--N-acetylmuramyl-(pentapeptide) pyrophosphoryl-undecaprenol N-acetylglucosamine transferase
MKVLYGSSPIGLGHATRDAVIARGLVDRGDATVAFLTGFPASRYLADEGFRVLDRYAAPTFDVVEGRLRHPLRWFLRYGRFYRACRSLARTALREERPDFVVADEDLALAREAADAGVPHVLVTDVESLTLPRGPMARLAEPLLNRWYLGALRGAPVVLVPEEGGDRGNLVHVGAIVRRPGASRSALRERFGFRRPTVLVATGGTDCGRFLVERTLEARRRLGRKDVDWIVATGPSWTHTTPVDGVRFLGYVQNLHEMVYAADLVVTLAGKTTMDECVAYGTPFVAIPIADHFEQEANAARYGYRPTDLARLEALIAARLDAPRGPFRPDGAHRCVETILTQMDRP